MKRISFGKAGDTKGLNGSFQSHKLFDAGTIDQAIDFNNKKQFLLNVIFKELFDFKI